MPAPPMTHPEMSCRRPPCSPTLQALPCPLGSEPSCSPSPTTTTSPSGPLLARGLLAHSEMLNTRSGPSRGPRPCRAAPSGDPACVGPSTDSAPPARGSARAVARGHLHHLSDCRSTLTANTFSVLGTCWPARGSQLVPRWGPCQASLSLNSFFSHYSPAGRSPTRVPRPEPASVPTTGGAA